MDHNQEIIDGINTGNWMLDEFLKDEQKFKQWIISSNAGAWLLGSHVFSCLIKLGEIGVNYKKEDSWGEFIKQALSWSDELIVNEAKTIKIAKCIIVLEKISEKRLATTAGNG